ncbi:multidrug effflux MFS transporter [Microbacterium sediminicola]|uniref:Multidrug effflux MFS transporter n=1 Tax=Microbacterium sediminicola TaxID=415210 RepID=A0ABN2I7W2_9MICO
MTRPQRLTAGLVVALGFLAAVGPFSTDMYLASFTEIGDALQTDASAVQLTLTTFLIGIAAGQLLFGPLSDRVGRRPVLVVALIGFAVSSIALVFVPSIELFVVLRFLQGFAGAAGIVLARAIAVDLSEGETAVKALSMIAMVVGVAPLVAPVVGGFVTELVGWRGVLGLIAIIASAMAVVSLTLIPESLPAELRHTGGIGETFRRFGELVRDRGFVLFTLAYASTFGAIMAYVSASPFVGQVVLGMSPVMYSVGFGIGASAILLSNLINARLAVRFGPRTMLVVGIIGAGSAAAALLAQTLLGILTPVGFIVSAFFLTSGLGFTMPNSTALGLARADRARGAGAALMGSTQFLVGGLISPLVGIAGEDHAEPMAIVIAVALALGSIAAIAALRVTRRGRRS